MESNKYVLIQQGYTISYNETDCLENNKPINKNEIDKRTTIEIAEDLQLQFYNSFLKRHFKNIVVLSAAGTSFDNGESRGKTREGLWKECVDEIKDIYILCPKIKDKDFDKTNDIEGLLTAIILHEKVNEEIVDSKSESIRKKIEKKIAKSCTLILDKNKAPHIEFLNKLTARKPSDPRIQLFTTNYDTLFEQAANEAGFVVIDGFSFTQPRKFSGRYFDYDIVNREKTRLKQEESFVSKVFHLYKLHGSLNWENNEGVILQKDKPNEPLIIYPASEKYESSYEQPYFEMMSRFQQALRKDNTLLIVIGFGFQDKHIQNVIIEAVEQNPSFQLVIVNFNNSGSINTDFLKPFFNDISKMEVKRNVNILYDTFGSFTKKYPSNQTYIETTKGNRDETL